MKKSLTAGLSAAALIASAASVALVNGATAHAAGEPSSAFGIEAKGLIPIDAMPYVESTDGELVTDELAEIPGDPLINVGLIEVEAENGRAKSTVAGLGVGDGLLAQLPAELTDALGEVCTNLTPVLDAGGELAGTINQILGTAEGALVEVVAALEDALQADVLTGLNLGELLPEDLSSLCDALTGGIELVGAGVITAECTGDTGTSSVADLTSVLGLPIDVGSEPNRSLAIDGLIELTLNRQTTNADGTFTVDALYLNLLGEIELTVASATCGEVTADKPPAEEPDEPEEAPEPKPGPGNVPVTG